ncbi:FecR family protein [Algoriphagus sediminis]|uniref:FecR family protein n=1 Tax=Algoriphagus sediminis TaxID=3057113 RepID=A0ABT7YFG1_9BACT|nr:FecR family protein [Algoriphagus sediminis]MDN3205262.1 FecR family protein [Algoriphagus sediminis]
MSEKEAFDIETLIAKFITDECNDAEVQQLEEWRAQSEENEKYVADALMIFQRAELDVDEKFDSNKAWQSVSERIETKPRSRTAFIGLWKIAAGLILIAALSYLFFQQINSAEEFNFSSDAKVQVQTLPDQTTLALNRDSESKVIYNEKKNIGIIELSGEAFISIPEDKKVNWQVKVEELIIEDIGTEFNVKAYPESPEVEVSVLSGEVRIYLENEEGINIMAGQKGAFNKSSGEFQLDIADPNVSAYQSRNFTYQNQTLETIADQLSEVYQIPIILDGDIGACTLTVNFENEELEDILSIISETLGLEVNQTKESITLSGDGCF